MQALCAWLPSESKGLTVGTWSRAFIFKTCPWSHTWAAPCVAKKMEHLVDADTGEQSHFFSVPGTTPSTTQKVCSDKTQHSR